MDKNASSKVVSSTVAFLPKVPVVNAQRKRRLTIIVVTITGLLLASLAVLYALRSNINLFYTPSQIARGESPKDAVIRLGGMVEKGSVIKDSSSLLVTFSLTDFNNNIQVRYEGVLPTLFREEQGIVTQGTVTPKGTFIAQTVLAKHDANYMSPEVKASLKKNKGMS